MCSQLPLGNYDEKENRLEKAGSPNGGSFCAHGATEDTGQKRTTLQHENPRQGAEAQVQGEN